MYENLANIFDAIKFPPTTKSLAMPTPPFVMIEPVDELVAFIFPSTAIDGKCLTDESCSSIS